MDTTVRLIKPSLKGDKIAIDMSELVMCMHSETGEFRLKRDADINSDWRWDIDYRITVQRIEKLLNHVVTSMEMGECMYPPNWFDYVVNVAWRNDLYYINQSIQSKPEDDECYLRGIDFGDYDVTTSFWGDYFVFGLVAMLDNKEKREKFQEYMERLYKAVTEIVDPKHVYIFE